MEVGKRKFLKFTARALPGLLLSGCQQVEETMNPVEKHNTTLTSDVKKRLEEYPELANRLRLQTTKTGDGEYCINIYIDGQHIGTCLETKSQPASNSTIPCIVQKIINHKYPNKPTPTPKHTATQNNMPVNL